MMKLSPILVTSLPDVAERSVSAGVDKVMVDLETIGKFERQGHLDTLISSNRVEDIAGVIGAIGSERTIVRTNGLHPGIKGEVEGVIDSGPAFIMIPMVKSVEQVKEFGSIVKGRAGLIALVETVEGMRNLKAIAEMPEVDEIYIGLNDLQLEMGTKFMFEPLANGMIDQALELVASTGKPYGFGGIARMDEGLVSGKLILAEHVRLRSSRVILSRTFHRRLSDSNVLAGDNEFYDEIRKLKVEEAQLRAATDEALEDYHGKLIEAVNEIVNRS